jgi:hypothetical protein
MEGHCSTGQSPQWATVPMEEEQEDADTLNNGLLLYLVASESLSISHIQLIPELQSQ